MSLDHLGFQLSKEPQTEALEPDIVAKTDSNNNDNRAFSRSASVVSDVLLSPTSSDDPLKILIRGPDYLRARIFQRQSGFERPTPQKSAAELLKASKGNFTSVDNIQRTAMSANVSPTNHKSNITEEMSSSERGLVESMQTKLCIPKTDTPPADSFVANPDAPPASLRPAVAGKRRMCMKCDDSYGGQKQRLRLGSAEATLPADGTYECKDHSDDGNTKHDGGFPQMTSFSPSQSSPGRWNWTGFPAGQQPTGQVTGGEDSTMDKWPGGSELREMQPKRCNVHFGGQLASDVECMDVESRNQGVASTAEVVQRSSGYRSKGFDFKVDREDRALKNAFRTGSLGAGEWRDSVLENERNEDGRGIRTFRKYKKVVGKSGSRSDLVSRLASASEQASQLARNSADLEAFFTEMGMDRVAIESALTEGNIDHTLSTTSLNVFENISSIGTPLDSRSCTSRDSQQMDEIMSKSLDLDEQAGLGLSVVERNARVIRWLCNIRKVSAATDDGEV